MIQASELAKQLRIGNIISWTNVYGERPWERSETYTVVDGYLLYTLESVGDQDPALFYEGVPLTPEILKQCGFTKREDGYLMSPWIGDYAIGFAYGHPDKPLLFKIQAPWTAPFDPKEEVKIAMSHEHTKYLHQLQNAFYVWTNTELTVTI